MNQSQYSSLFVCIDHTSLSGTDTKGSIALLCQQAIDFQSPTLPHVAAVCVYPEHVRTAAGKLHGTGIKVASVVGGFPHGQVPLPVKTLEARLALESGADEIDMVINRGHLLEGRYDACALDIKEIKKVCQEVRGGAPDRHLKVILETGELLDPQLIYRASMLAMEAGADFIKTSTGKIPRGATLEAASEMLKAIKEFHKISKKWVGFKAAGGISTPGEALAYYELAEQTYGPELIGNQLFRIGTSRLTEKLFHLINDNS